MTSDDPRFSMRFGPEADAFDARRRAGDLVAMTGGHSTALTDWKGESARASGTSVPPESTSETAQPPTFQLTSYQ